MNKGLADILEENAERRADLHAEYDPVTGEGSPIERMALPMTSDRGRSQGVRSVQIPQEMASQPVIGQLVREHGTVEAWAEAQGNDAQEALQDFHRFRATYDFEFWCATAANIELDAEAREERGADIAPLILNRAQRQYWAELHRQWTSDEPVRIILLKARQWGGSTLTQCFFAWVQRFHRDAWNSFICSLTDDQARNLRRMYTRLADHYPSKLGEITMSPYEGSSKVKEIDQTGSIIGVNSVESKDSIRTYDIHLAHLSEVGFWPSTPQVNAEDYATGITGAVSKVSGTVIVEESTARGVGTYFHNHWQEAKKGESSYEPVFIGWQDIPKYTEPIEEPPDFVRHRLRPGIPDDDGRLRDKDELARRLWRLGATLGGIKWYIDMLAEFKGDLSSMRTEFPSTPQEAFQSTGRRFFGMDLSARLREQTSPPAQTGRLVADGEAGEAALNKIRFKEREEGSLKVWRRPDDKVWWNGKLLTPRSNRGSDRGSKRVARRFCAFCDFGGKTETADWSVITIGDRIKMLRGGPVEVVARLRVHMRPDRFAWASARLAQWYGEALLAYEINRHRKDRGDDVRGYEPEWSLAVIKEVEGVYDNLYYREVQERIDEKVELKVGFHMNQSTKPMIYNALDAALSREPVAQIYYDPDRQFVDEVDTFEKKEDGRLGAVENNHDDVLDSTAGTAWLALKHMEPPAVVDAASRAGRHEPSAAQF